VLHGQSDTGSSVPRSVSAEASLLPRVLGAFLLALSLASVLTLVLENRLTRQELQDQARTLIVDEVSQLRVLLDQEQQRLSAQVSSTAERIRAGRYSEDIAVANLLSELERSSAGELALLNVFTADGRPAAVLGDLVAAPSEELRARLAQGGPGGSTAAIVPMVSSPGFASVAVQSFRLASDGEASLFVAGRRLDTSAALNLRTRTGASTAFIVVGDRIVASSDPELDGTPAPALGGDELPVVEPVTVELGGEEALLVYAPIGRVMDTESQALVGIAIQEPLSSLDQRLFQNRVVMVALLIAVAGMLAFLLARLVTRPLTALTETAQRIAGGDLEARFETESDDEIGILAGALERMRAALSTQLGVNAEQARALRHAARRMVNVQDEERRRVARDLHDGVQQQLVMLRMKVGVARAQMSTDRDVATDTVSELADDIDQIIGRLRETSQDLYPSILQDRGLTGALHSLAARSSLPIEVATEPAPLPRLDPAVESNAYFLVAEAVTNAAKHAVATHVDIHVSQQDGELVVAVADDGRGMRESTEGRPGGIRHMRDRVAAVGGSLTIESAPGAGVRVVARFPSSVQP
jgi:signal transduction histidine kinase